MLHKLLALGKKPHKRRNLPHLDLVRVRSIITWESDCFIDTLPLLRYRLLITSSELLYLLLLRALPSRSCLLS